MTEFGDAGDRSGRPAGPRAILRPGAAGLAQTLEPPGQGLSPEQVVQQCGELCQAINGLALELAAPVETADLKTLHLCLDDVVAGAISEFSHQGKRIGAGAQTPAANQRIGFLAQELRRHITTATFALRLMKSGKIGFSGALSGVLDRSLAGLRTLAYPFLAQVRVSPGTPAAHQLISVADLLAELVRVTAVEAQSRGCRFTTAPVHADLAVRGDRTLLLAAIKNLLQNAFKFTRYGTEVTLTAMAVGDHVHIEVQSQCGGLAPETLEDLFRPFTPHGEDLTDLEASHGTLSVRDLPGSGCIFCIRLPTHLLPVLP